MKIYTKTGDKGKTSLFGGDRVEKDSLRISINGTVDELNSLFGLIVSELDMPDIEKLLIREQSNMLRTGADIATRFNVDKKYTSKIDRINTSDTMALEQEIDSMTLKLPKLTRFILPGGTKAASFTHHARSVCRRVERQVYSLAKKEEINQELLPYINRLSDWLFTIARFINYKSGVSDVFN